MHPPVICVAERKSSRLRLHSAGFAGQFGFSVNTLRHWERGKLQPEGPTRAYLLVIERAPKAVQKAQYAA
jgi:putative transcriptional regulator